MDTLKIFSALFIFMVILSAGFNLILPDTTFNEVTDTFDKTAVPVNFTLTGFDPQSLINVTNGTVSGSVNYTAVSNFTNNVTDGFIEVLDNVTFGGDTVVVTYLDRQASFLNGTEQLIIFVVFIIAVVLVINAITKRKSGK